MTSMTALEYHLRVTLGVFVRHHLTTELTLIRSDTKMQIPRRKRKRDSKVLNVNQDKDRILRPRGVFYGNSRSHSYQLVWQSHYGQDNGKFESPSPENTPATP